MMIESVNATRSMLLHASRSESLRVVMVTSALEGEGKTSLSGHLSTSLAAAGRRTVLVDCDLRRPAAHRLFDVPARPGICELLRGQVELADVIQATRAPGLSIITAGAADSRSIQALARGDLQAIFDVLEAEFDFVIVDSAPVLPVADTLVVSQHVDAVIFAILQEVSRVPRVHSAYQRLSALGVRILGAVVAGTTSETYGSRYPQVIDP
jgi:capsular exopolysaccharide synthesis family protein